MPPSNIGKMSTSINLISNKWNKKALVKKEETYNNYMMEQKKMKK